MLRATITILLTVLWSVGCAAEPIRYRLPNGLRVILRPVKDAQNTAVVVHFDIGGNHDPPGRSGMAHLLEHLYVCAAAGNAPARTAEAYMRGGGNAQTGEDYTFVAEQVDTARLYDALEDAAERMRGLRLDAALVERERGRLLSEVTNMFGGMPALAATNLARERLRPTPNGGRRGGAPDQVGKITLHELSERHTRYYKPTNATLVVVGGFDVKRVRASIDRLFGAIPSGAPAPVAGKSPIPRARGIAAEKVRAAQREPGPEACVTYAAPLPTSPDYAPFLALVGRMFQRSAELGAKPGQRFPPCVQFAFLEDPYVISIGGPLRAGESPEQAVSRIRTFITNCASQPLTEIDQTSAGGMLDFASGTVPIFQASMNPYGVALALARSARLGMDPKRLKRVLSGLKESDLRRTASRVFAPKAGAAVVVIPR